MRTYNVFQQATGTGLAGKTTSIDLETSFDTRYLMLTLKATVTLGGVGNAAAIRNLGSVAAMYDRIRITESGKDTGVGKLLSFWIASEALRGSAGTFTRQTSLVNGNVANLVERIMIPFERLLDAMPSESRYRVRNPGNRFQIQFDMNAAPETTILTLGAGPSTAAITNATIDVRQYVAESSDSKLPAFAPRWREQILAVSGASASLRHELDIGNDWIAGITVLQETTTTGLVSDIITSFQLRTDSKIYIGESGLVTWADYAADKEWVTSGNVFSLAGGSGIHLDFRESGRKSHMIDPSTATKLRFLFNAAPSASAGASQIRTLLHVMSRDESVGANGRRVISPTVGFPV